jgi:flagellar biosynthetic protein FliR
MELLIGKFLVFILIFIRVFAMFSVGPLFGSASVPVPARLFLSLTTAYIMLLIVPDMPIAYDSAFGILALLGVKEAITGMIMGFSLNFVFYGVSYAAYQMGIDMGLNMATLFDPATEVENNVLGQIFNWAAILLFLTLNGHHYFIRGLAVSFKIIPLGHYTINESVYTLLLRGSAGIFITAVKIAAPVMVAFFLLHTALGIISRVIPQMQVFFVVQPVQLMLGFTLVASGMPLFIYIIRFLLEQMEDNLYDLIKVMGY